MGGTSTDVALVQDLSPRIGRETKVGDLTVRASSVDVRTVGAGGGSIAHVPGAHPGAAGRPAVRGSRPRPGGLRQGRRRSPPSPTPTWCSATSPRSWPAARSRSTSRPPAPRSAKIAEAMGLRVAGGRRGRHRRHRQREHARRSAAGLGAAGLRPARLRARRLRRRRAAARQRARRAHRCVAGDRAAVAGRAVRARRRDDEPARRVGPHGAPPVRRPRRATSCVSLLGELAARPPAAGSPSRA